MTLTEFLLARIAEVEAAAQESKKWQGGRDWHESNGALFDKGSSPMADSFGEAGDEYWLAFTAHVLQHQPNRVLAECEAKRHIVECYEADPTKFLL